MQKESKHNQGSRLETWIREVAVTGDLLSLFPATKSKMGKITKIFLVGALFFSLAAPMAYANSVSDFFTTKKGFTGGISKINKFGKRSISSLPPVKAAVWAGKTGMKVGRLASKTANKYNAYGKLTIVRNGTLKALSAAKLRDSGKASSPGETKSSRAQKAIKSTIFRPWVADAGRLAVNTGRYINKTLNRLGFLPAKSISQRRGYAKRRMSDNLVKRLNSY